MSCHIKFIDGRLIQIGPSSEAKKVTDFDFLKIEKNSGEDVFVTNCLCRERMGSYIYEALGKNIRLFHVETEISPGKMSGTILGIEIESGKRFSVANELDKDMATIKSMLFNKTILYWFLVALTVFFFCMIIFMPLGLVSATFAYLAFKDKQKLTKGLATIPSTKEFENFFSSNSRKFEILQPAKI